MKGRLILLRHGQSLYNKKNLFTGWSDIDLSEQGVQEAKAAGETLSNHGVYPDICFTSWLKRAIHTAQLTLKEMQWEQIDTIRSWKLNERHYGAWQQHDKEAIKAEVGDAMFAAVRRGYAMSPPALEEGDPRLSHNSSKYKAIDPTLLPRSESLEDTAKRALNYFFEKIVPQLANGKTVLVSAHGNSLRALVMAIEKIGTKEIEQLEIPTGVPIVYDFDEMIEMTDKRILKKNQ
ncbi:MAG: 2,3-bisphosphoglycerate-dependent phosphoglycerate mutase [Thiovulaceae bacterium]|nr:2,3-bisphosphoglycerate-dependent phosphoglycerate mutase [Sulfurimonadaceae bacterium]